MNIYPAVAELFHTNGQTGQTDGRTDGQTDGRTDGTADRYNEANNLFSKFCKEA